MCNKPLDLCFDAYFKHPKTLGGESFDALMQIAYNIANATGFKLAFLSYSEPEAEDVVTVKLDAKETASARDKYSVGAISSISLFTPDMDKHVSASLHLAVEMNESPDCMRVYIQSKAQWLINDLQRRFDWSIAVLKLLSQFALIENVVVTPLRRTAKPFFYFAGIGNRALTADERLNMLSWDHNQGVFQERLRGVYWGNLLGNTHLQQLPDPMGFINSLKVLLGDKRVKIFDDGRVFFALDNSNRTLEQVRSLCSQSGLLLIPDNKIRSMADRFA